MNEDAIFRAYLSRQLQSAKGAVARYMATDIKDPEVDAMVRAMIDERIDGVEEGIALLGGRR